MNNLQNNFDQPFPSSSVQQSHVIQQPRKRTRQSDADADPKLVAKRAKAAERQRRKRERDRRNTLGAMFPTAPQPPSVGSSAPPPGSEHVIHPSQPEPLQVLTEEEERRREKVRAAARERQRKHRALMKQKKMAELGLAMGADGVNGLEEVHYALGPDGSYQPVPPPNAHIPELGDAGHHYQIPNGTTQTGGQTFASTLLLSFSCSPLLKQHVLRTLSMTNEELSSLEPILSAAFDQWDQARRLHYAEQAAKAGHQTDGAGPSNGPPTNPYGPPPGSEVPNDFHARFHRPLVAPSPFSTNVLPLGAPPGHLDPNLNNATPNNIAQVVEAAVAAISENNNNNAMNNVTDGNVNAGENSAVINANGEVKDEGRLGKDAHEDPNKEKEDPKVSDGGTKS